MEINKCYNENNLDTMSRMPDEFVDLTVTSPPYDNLRDYKGYSFDFESVAKELFRVTKKGGVVVWVVSDQTMNGTESGTSFRQALFFMECGFNLHDTMIYAKNNFIPLSHNRYEQAFEYMFVLSKGKPKTFNGIRVNSKSSGQKYNHSRKGSNTEKGAFRRRNETVEVKETKLHSNIFYYSTGFSGQGHPAPFPEKLVLDQINTWSNEGDLIFDPFCGSGTTPKVSILLKRNWIASEISSEYCEIIDKRLKPFKEQPFLF